MQFRQQSKDKIVVVQGCQVILDSDVAALYGVETKRVNEALKMSLLTNRWTGTFSSLPRQNGEDLRSKISTTKSAKVRYAPKAFTEKGLYMLATILNRLLPITDDNRNYRNLCKGERTVSHDVGVART